MYVGELENWKESEVKIQYKHKKKYNTKGCTKTITMEESRHGFLSLMCPHCFNIVTRQVDYDISSSVEAIQHVDGRSQTPDLHLFFSKNYKMTKCPKCKSKYVDMIELDPNISKAISLLNKKGYFTSYCCEGHGRYDTGYVVFTNKYQVLEHLNTLPITWCLDYNDIKQQKSKLIIRTEYCNKAEAMVDLLDWANGLPFNVILGGGYKLKDQYKYIYNKYYKQKE